MESRAETQVRFVSPISLLVAGVIHLLPLSGALGGARLTALYGLPFDDPTLALLMRHRAVLFGLLGVLLLAAAFRPRLRDLAFGAGLVSVVSFLGLAASGGPFTQGVQRVVTADWIALLALVTGLAAHLAQRHRERRTSS